MVLIATEAQRRLLRHSAKNPGVGESGENLLCLWNERSLSSCFMLTWQCTNSSARGLHFECTQETDFSLWYCLSFKPSDFDFTENWEPTVSAEEVFMEGNILWVISTPENHQCICLLFQLDQNYFPYKNIYNI